MKPAKKWMKGGLGVAGGGEYGEVERDEPESNGKANAAAQAPQFSDGREPGSPAALERAARGASRRAPDRMAPAGTAKWIRQETGAPRSGEIPRRPLTGLASKEGKGMLADQCRSRNAITERQCDV